MTETQAVIVEDDAVSMAFMEGVLRKNGISVSVFDNVRDAILYINTRQQGIDVIISDIKMPGDDGFELCRLVSQNKSTKNIPVLLVSSWYDSETMMKSYDSGCYDFIKKPIDSDELLFKVKTASAAHRQLRKIDSKAKKSKSAAFDAMEQCNKMSNILELADSSRRILTLASLAEKTFEVFSKNDINSSLLFIKDGETEFYSPEGSPSPLEPRLMSAVMLSDKFSSGNRFFELHGRLFVKYDTVLALIKNPNRDDFDAQDYIAAIFNFVDGQAKLIFHEETREKEIFSDRESVIAKFEESATELKGIFSSQMSMINSVVDLIMSEISVKFASLDVCEHTEKIIFETVSNALTQIGGSVERGSQVFDSTIEELLSDLHTILLDNNLNREKL